MFGGCCNIAAIERARGGDQRAFAHLRAMHRYETRAAFTSWLHRIV